MTDEEGWIKHDGGPCPVPGYTWVQITSTRGVVHDDVLPADKWEWQYIAAYRVFMPASLVHALVGMAFKEAAQEADEHKSYARGLECAGDCIRSFGAALTLDDVCNAAERMLSKAANDGIAAGKMIAAEMAADGGAVDVAVSIIASVREGQQ